jgi:hypothetical protein
VIRIIPVPSFSPAAGPHSGIGPRGSSLGQALLAMNRMRQQLVARCLRCWCRAADPVRPASP